MAYTANSVLSGVPAYKTFLNKMAELIIAAVVVTFFGVVSRRFNSNIKSFWSLSSNNSKMGRLPTIQASIYVN